MIVIVSLNVPDGVATTPAAVVIFLARTAEGIDCVSAWNARYDFYWRKRLFLV